MLSQIRKASYKEPFTHWLPLYITASHGERSMPLIKEAMAKICADAYGSFEPWMILEVIPKLMNSFVVQVMSGKLCVAGGRVCLLLVVDVLFISVLYRFLLQRLTFFLCSFSYGSIMALEGYCAFHQLFLVLLEEHPELKVRVDDIIRAFLRNDSARHKREVPALGEWLPLLCVTETFAWADVAAPYLAGAWSFFVIIIIFIFIIIFFFFISLSHRDV